MGDRCCADRRRFRGSIARLLAVAGAARQAAHGHTVTPHELPRSVDARWWARLHRFVIQEIPQFADEITDEGVATISLLLHGLYHHPVEFAVQIPPE